MDESVAGFNFLDDPDDAGSYRGIRPTAGAFASRRNAVRQPFGCCSRRLKLDAQGIAGRKGKLVEREIEMGRLPAGGESQEAFRSI
jgi:hypothetical protein